ncbi:MAG TPA: hypothetical protein VIJ57_12010, partial [Hanamia sp.]
GIKNAAMEGFCFLDYVEVLRDRFAKTVEFYTLRSTNHEIYTKKQTKIALSWEDSKKVRHSADIKSRIYSHGFI